MQQDGQKQVEKDQIHDDEHEWVEENRSETFGTERLNHKSVPVVTYRYRKDWGEAHAQVVEVRPECKANITFRVYWKVVLKSNLMPEEFHAKKRKDQHKHEE